MNERRWVAERAVCFTLFCPRCNCVQEHVTTKDREAQGGAQAPLLAYSDMGILHVHCRECSI